MELKFSNIATSDSPMASFNRTFMELKYQYTLNGCLGKSGFNRTFMELKYSFLFRVYTPYIVLIVPLWN